MKFVEHKIIRGEGAGKWLPFARQKAARLHAQAQGGARTQRWTVDQGMVDIKVSVQGDQRHIHIERKGCPPFLSGLCDLVLHKEGDVPGADIPFTPVYQVDDPNDPDPAVMIDVFRRFYPSPATPPADRAWRDEPRLARDHDAAKQMITLKASMFSGQMRKVVQVLQGMNVEIPYSPAWGPTHGVFTASSGQPWVIEIANEGILAWPMSICRNPVTDADGVELLSYTPIATPKPTGAAFDAALANGDIIRLADADEMRACYSRIPFFTNCGWAFNSDGHEAANAVWHMEGEYVKTAIAVVHIAEVNGRPATATASLVEGGYLHGARYQCQLKFPLGDRRRFYSFDTSPGDPPFLHNSEAPVFVFYDGATRVVVKYINDLSASHTDVYADSFPDFQVETCVSPSIFGVQSKSGTEVHQAQAHLEGDEIPAAPTYLSASTLNTQDMGYPNFLGLAFLDANNAQYGHVYDLHQIAFSTRSGVTDSEVTLSAMVVPLDEREGYYYAHLIRRTNSESSRELRTEPVYEEGFFQEAEIIPPSHNFSGHCGDANGTTEITGLSGDSLAGVCDAGQWRGRVTPAQTIRRYFPGLSVGAAVIAATNATGACVLQGTPHPPATDISLDGESYSTHAPIFFFRGSGGVRYPLPTPRGTPYLFNVDGLATALFRFIEANETQAMVVVRDAFDPHKFALSPGINLVASLDLKSELSDYPVAEASANRSLIGVP